MIKVLLALHAWACNLPKFLLYSTTLSLTTYENLNSISIDMHETSKLCNRMCDVIFAYITQLIITHKSVH